MPQSAQPILRLEKDNLSLLVYENEYLREGERSVFLTCILARKFRNKDGEMGSSSSLGFRDLPTAIRLLELGYDAMLARDGEVSDDLRQLLSPGRKPSRSKRNAAAAADTLPNGQVSPEQPPPTAIPVDASRFNGA